jgi:hypothetical protein
MINISQLSKAEVLASLYNNSKVQGMGIFQAKGGAMTTEQAQSELDQCDSKYFDYLHGKVMKVDLSKDEFNPFLYDRDNGEGAAQKAIELISKK